MVKEVWSTVFWKGCNHLSCIWWSAMWSCHSPKRSTSPRLESKRGPSDCFDQESMAEGMLCWLQAQLLTGRTPNWLSCVPCLQEYQFLKSPDSKNLTDCTTSSTQWTWVWANLGRQWRTGKPSMLQSMGSQSQTRLSDWTVTKDFMWFGETVCGDFC